jgi:hypothetical protein
VRCFSQSHMKGVELKQESCVDVNMCMPRTKDDYSERRKRKVVFLPVLAGRVR